jgi:hypothetical protein
VSTQKKSVARNAVCLVSEKRSPGRGRDGEERARRQLKYRCQSFKIGLVC